MSRTLSIRPDIRPASSLIARARRKDEDRDLGPLAQPPDDFRAVEVGQAEIEDDHVGLAGGGLDEAALAGLRLEHFEPLAR